MKNKYLIIIGLITCWVMMFSCKKESHDDDKNKIDVKGSLTNGDMRNPNLEATLEDKTVWVWFYDDLGTCTISIRNTNNSIIVCDTVDTYYNASWRFFMGDQPLGRYHLVISDGTDEAEGWFDNGKVVVVAPKK